MSIFKNYDELVGIEPHDKGRKIVLDIMEAGVESVLPENAMKDMFERSEEIFPEKLTVFGWGKASMGMYKAFKQNFKGDISQAHLISQENGSSLVNEPNIEISRGAHPIPDESSLRSGKRLMEIAKSLDEDDTLICLISGGGSSMFEVPKDEIPLDILRETYRFLLESGANIHEVNSIRRAISKNKGGDLAKAVYPARIINIVMSDVPGNNLEDIASGPTVIDPLGIRPNDVVWQYGMDKELEGVVLETIANYRPPDERYFRNIKTLIIADNKKAQNAMCKKAKDQGYKVTRYSDYLTGEARKSVISYLETPGDLIIGGGETTVTVRGKGNGGRNQEFVLAGLEHLKDGVLASMGTDGIDGFTKAAGALGDIKVLNMASEKGLDIRKYLEDNNSFDFFRGCKGSLITGPTGTNVADICVFLRGFG